MLKEKREEIASFYILKALCAFGVVSLHCPSGLMTEYLGLISSVTVPIFFMITGYFLYTEDVVKLQKKIVDSVKKILVIILIAHSVYTLVYWQWMFGWAEYVLWAKWIILGQHFAGGHLWYLTALVQTLLVFYILAKMGWLRYTPYLLIGLVFKLVFEDYKPLIFGSEASMLSANALFSAIPWLTLGWLFRKYKAYLTSLPNISWIVLIVIIAAYVNQFLLPSETLRLLIHPWTRLAMICTIFIWALQSTSWGKGSKLEYIGKHLSGNIYYWHNLMISLTAILVSNYVFDNWAALIASVLSLILSLFIYRVQRMLNVNYLP